MSRSLIVVVLAVLAWSTGPGVAQAHTTLRTSTPADGGVVTEPVTTVTLEFSGSVRGPEVVVTGPDGAVVSTGVATADGAVVTVAVTPVAAGAHTVTWAVTSADGHEIGGTTTFTYAGPLPTSAEPTSAEPTSAEPTSKAPATPAPTESTLGADEVAEAAATDPAEDGSNLLVRAVQALLVIAAVGGAVLLARRYASGSAGKSR